MASDIWELGILCTFRSRSALPVVWIIIAIISDFQVEGHRCRSDWCNYNEYCCGPDICCDFLTGYWYIWMITGVLLFTVILVCCWGRYYKYHSLESVESHELNYVPIVDLGPYGKEYYIHQQPPLRPLMLGPTTGKGVATEHKGEIPLPPTNQSEDHQNSGHYPPPYTHIERRAPSAPPPSP